MSQDNAAPGWYHAEGDPVGTERYWDGSAWTDGPRPIAPSGPAAAPMAPPSGSGMPVTGAPPATGGAPASGGFGMTPPADGSTMQPLPTPVGGGLPPQGVFTEPSKAGLSLGLVIGGLLCCGPIAIAGTVIAYQEKEAIDAGRRDPSKRGMAVAALVIGGLALLLWLGLLILTLVGGAIGG